MKRHRVGSHTPEEMRWASNLGHVTEGVLLGTVGVLALLAGLGLAAWAAVAWPVLLLVAGLLLLLIMYPTHPFADWHLIWRDAQQRQHTLLATGAAVAGAAELARPAVPALGYVWPAIAVGMGILFLIHEQHGTGEAVLRAVWQHRLLGALMVAAGALRFVDLLTPAPPWAALWPVALLVAAALLFVYREPPGAYEPGAHQAHH